MINDELPDAFFILHDPIRAATRDFVMVKISLEIKQGYLFKSYSYKEFKENPKIFEQLDFMKSELTKFIKKSIDEAPTFTDLEVINLRDKRMARIIAEIEAEKEKE